MLGSTELGQVFLFCEVLRSGKRYAGKAF